MSLRFDRFATLYLFNPLQSLVASGNRSIPILMYHSITDDDEARLHPYYRTATSPVVFKQHMKQLRELGYRTLQMADAVKLLQGGGSTRECAVVTFDDGYADFYRHAFPELNCHGFTATVFLPTAYIGMASAQFKGKDCLTWSEVRELRKYGICFGSHTVTHPQLSALDSRKVKDEIVSSKRMIEDKLGESVDSFSYPFAFPEADKPFIRLLRKHLVDSGYDQGVSTCIGTACSEEDSYFLSRVPMNSLDDIPLFSAKLQGGYNWLRKVQYFSKWLKAHS